MGVYVSLDEEHEKRLRKIVEEDYGGVKGSLTEAVQDAIDVLAQEKERQKAADRMLAHMKKGLKGFSMNLKGRKLYENRSELYDHRSGVG